VDVGILGGTGPAGRGLALRLAAGGKRVVIGSRQASRAEEIVAELRAAWPGRELGLSGGDNEAAAGAALVVVATPWDGIPATCGPLADVLADKVVVSMANALIRQGRELVALIGPRGSVAAGLQAQLPRSSVAAAFHHLPAADLADLEQPLAADVLVCADRPEAAAATVDLVRVVPGLRPLEAGSLAQAAAIEAFTAVCVTLNIRHRAHVTLRLGGI
jgi:NADPH-dependent F420 reductase